MDGYLKTLDHFEKRKRSFRFNLFERFCDLESYLSSNFEKCQVLTRLLQKQDVRGSRPVIDVAPPSDNER